MCHRSRLVCVSCSLYRGCWDLRLSWLQESIVRPLFHKRKCGTVEFLKFKNDLHFSSWPRRLCYFTFPHLKTSQLAATMETPPQPSCLLSVPPVLFACLSLSSRPRLLPSGIFLVSSCIIFLPSFLLGYCFSVPVILFTFLSVKLAEHRHYVPPTPHISVRVATVVDSVS